MTFPDAAPPRPGGVMARTVLLSLALACLPLTAAAAPPTDLPLPPPSAAPGEAGPPPEPCDRAYPITLQSALELSGARALDVQLAGARVNEALAELLRAR